jgi:hypothetical protein
LSPSCGTDAQSKRYCGPNILAVAVQKSKSTTSTTSPHTPSHFLTRTRPPPFALTEKGEVGEGARVAARVRAAQRRHGLPGPHLRRRWGGIVRVRQCSLVARGPPRARAAHAALGRVRRQDPEARRLPALQARAPAPPAPRLRLRPRRRRALQSSHVQVNAMQTDYHTSMSCKEKDPFSFLFGVHQCEQAVVSRSWYWYQHNTREQRTILWLQVFRPWRSMCSKFFLVQAYSST